MFASKFRRICKRKDVQSERGKNKVVVVGWEVIVPQVKVEMIGECTDVVGSFKFSEICFSKDGGP